MNLGLSDEQEAVRRLAKDFVDREIAPNVIAWDRAEEVDRSIVKKLGEVGFLGLTVAEEYGGSGGDHLAYCLVTEELGHGDSSVRGIVSFSLGLVAQTIAAWGSEAGASARTLARLFAAETGLAFGQWRERSRMQSAMPHLAAGLPSESVARRFGYATASSFTAAFHRLVGVTPRQYFPVRD